MFEFFIFIVCVENTKLKKQTMNNEDGHVASQGKGT